MGPSGYRVKFGTSDAEIVAALRADQEIDTDDLTDEQIIEATGWAYTVKAAAKKLAAVSGTRSARPTG